MDDWNDFGPAGQPDSNGPIHSDHSDTMSSADDVDAHSQPSSVALLPSSSSVADDELLPQDPARVARHGLFGARRERQVAEAVRVAEGLPHAEDDDLDLVAGASSNGSAGIIEPMSMRYPGMTERTVQKEIVKKGVLDDVPDDLELNREGFGLTPGEKRFVIREERRRSMEGEEEIASSLVDSRLLKHAQKSYTKLEVISAKEIKNLIWFFNVWIFIALAWTVISVILSNTRFLTKQAIPLPAELLYPHQQIGIPLAIELDTPFDPRIIQPSSQLPDNITKAIAIGLYQQGYQYGTNGLQQANHTQQNQTTLERQQQIPPPSGTPSQNSKFILAYFIEILATVPPRLYKLISHFSTFIFSLLMSVLTVLFAIRVFRQGPRHISHEQVWVFFLLLMATFYFNPFMTILRISEELQSESTRQFTGFVNFLDEWLILVRDVAFTAVSFFYVWASLHSYRILDPIKRLGFRSFYLPKFLLLAPYVTLKIMSHAWFEFQLSEVPMLSAPALLFIFSEYRIWNYLRAELLVCIIASVYEAVLVTIIVLQAMKTVRVLQAAPYMKYRTKRVGFRFFLYINFLFYPLYFILNCLHMFATPKGDRVLQVVMSIDFPRADVLFFYTAGPVALMAGYVMSTAYVHLPITSVGVIKGWFMSSTLAVSSSSWSSTNPLSARAPSATATTPPATSLTIRSETIPAPHSLSNSNFTSNPDLSEDNDKKIILAKDGTWANDEETPRSVVDNDDELERQIIEPITYRKRESQDSLELKANCFTMQTHVIMFNFAWYVYYYGTPKLDVFQSNSMDHVKQNPLPFEYSIAKHVRCEETDTQALVVDCSDRIIITFKGTTSMRNLRTSLRASHERLSSVVRMSVSGEDESGRLRRLFGHRYLAGKIHKGFACAYRSVADEIMEQVRILRERKQRPVFLTGHSLGGALATICSLDLWVKLDISRREIFVSTFGSPRVGNKDFARVYKEVVPLHWRIVVDPDMVAKLPNVGYAHVGKKVVLTPHGDMYIDPSALESRPWTGEAAVFAYHRKASYMLAMRAWCVRHHGMTYTPAFWPFPIREEDQRRFPGVREEEDLASERARKGKVTSKIIKMDAMVDALGRGETELANMAVVEKWSRLTRRLMLQDTLNRTEMLGSHV